MMSLASAASYFDRTPVLDPDSGIELFKGQVEPYDDSKRDAGAAYRRILSVKPGTTVPAARAVSVLGAVWLVGNQETDGLAEAHRTKYVLAPADTKVSISRLPDFLAGSASSVEYAGVEWVKNAKEIEASSNQPEMDRVYLAAGSDVRQRDVVWYAGYALLALAVHDQPSGYRVAECLRLDQVLPADATIARRLYVPGSGYSDAGTTTVKALRVRWQSLFEYGGQADERYQEGDCSLVLPAGTAVSTRDKITLDGLTWQPVALDSLAGAVVAHARRAAP